MCCFIGTALLNRFGYSREKKKVFRQSYPGKDQSGFTLLELMTTIALVAVLSGVGGYSYLNGMPERRVVRATRDLYNGIQNARSEAIERGQNITITFNSGDFIITDPGGTELSRHTFPPYIDLYSVTAGGAGDQYVFNERGMKTGVNGRVRIQYTRTGPLKRGVRVTSVGGITMIDETDPNWV